LKYKTSQNNVYWQCRTLRAVIDHHSTPTIVDAMLTLILKMGLRACQCLFVL
jgi:hypothetical protein